MIEVSISYDLLPNVDQKAYGQLLRRAIVPILKQPGIFEIRAHRSLSGSPQVRVVLVWETMADWNIYEMKREWTSVVEELGNALACNIQVQCWRPSPIAPETLRPPRSA